MRRALALLIFVSFPSAAKDFTFDKDTASVIWKCAKLVEANVFSEALKIPPYTIPDFCTAIGRSIGDLPPEKKL